VDSVYAALVTTLDLFAGPGGWDTGAEAIGVDTLGIEADLWAHRTALAAGHARIRADIWTLDPAQFSGIEGLVASPPCQGFSAASNSGAVGDSAALMAKINTEHLWELLPDVGDRRSALALLPLRWALVLRPAWVAFEQVPTVAPLWAACATILTEHGYSTWAGPLASECYGVPQTRTRAYLLARRDGSRAAPPQPTHSRFHPRTPQRLDPGVTPWVSMGTALGLDPDTYLRSNYQNSGTPGTRGVRKADLPAFTVTSKVSRNRWVGADQSGLRDWSRHQGKTVTIAQAALLQTFPNGYPWRGDRAARYTQIGDAVPPLLAAAVVSSLRA
jgi:DNA (cytosine-5)-methyltransferase 1